MTTQTEETLERLLIAQLSSNGYERVLIKDEADLVVNLKTQLEKFNQTTYTKDEFKLILNHLAQPLSPFDKAKVLRDRFSFRTE